MDYCVYILYSQKLDRHYVGTTDNLDRRLTEHNSDFYQDSFTSKGIPWELFFVLERLTSCQAYQIEKHIKKMKSRIYFENLKKYPELPEKLRQRYGTT